MFTSFTGGDVGRATLTDSQANTLDSGDPMAGGDSAQPASTSLLPGGQQRQPQTDLWQQTLEVGGGGRVH